MLLQSMRCVPISATTESLSLRSVRKMRFARGPSLLLGRYLCWDVQHEVLCTIPFLLFLLYTVLSPYCVKLFDHKCIRTPGHTLQLNSISNHFHDLFWNLFHNFFTFLYQPQDHIMQSDHFRDD
jgi:hypothetical protein